MTNHSDNYTVLTLYDIFLYLKRPAFVLIFGIIATWLAFNTGIAYARRNVQINSITHNLAFIEIAGEEHMYELDWWEDEPIVWNNN